MAIQINGNTVINDQRELGTLLTSAYDTVTAGGSATVTNRTVYYVTSSGRTITLPSPPEVGNEVIIVNGNFTDTVVSPGNTIYRIMGQGQSEPMTIDLPYVAVRLIYIDSTRGWVLA